MSIRIATFLVLCVGAFITPWYITLVCAFLCVAYYYRFFEALVPAVVVDVLYGAHPFLHIPGFVTVCVAVALIISLSSERYLRHHAVV